MFFIYLVLLCNGEGLSKGGGTRVCPGVVAWGVARGLLQGWVGGGCGAWRERACVVQAVLSAVHRGRLRAHRWWREEGGRQVALLHRDRDQLVLGRVQPVAEKCLQLTFRVLPLVDRHLLRVVNLLVLYRVRRHFDSKYQQRKVKISLKTPLRQVSSPLSGSPPILSPFFLSSHRFPRPDQLPLVTTLWERGPPGSWFEIKLWSGVSSQVTRPRQQPSEPPGLAGLQRHCRASGCYRPQESSRAG